MELDDLKAAWQALDQKLTLNNHLLLETRRQLACGKARSALRPLFIGQIIQVVCGTALALALPGLWFPYAATPHFLVCGILVQVYAAMLIALPARELALLGRIDYSAPVLAIQRELAGLRAARIQHSVLYGLTGCFIWVPLLLLIFRALGADLLVHKPSVFHWFLASAAVPLIIVLAAMQLSRLPGWERFRRGMHDGAAGASLTKTEKLLAEIADFEQQ